MGNSNSSRISERDRAILQLKVQRDKLKQYQKRIEDVIAKEIELARESLQTNNKQRALLALKKKKYQEQLLARLDEQLFQLEHLTQTIETSLIQQQIMKGLETGNKILADLHKETSLEAVEKLMDETRDGVDYQKQVEDTLRGAFTEEEDQEIIRELDEMIEKEYELPEVPKSLPVVAKAESEQSQTVDNLPKEAVLA